jgi:hypothetical protein
MPPLPKHQSFWATSACHQFQVPLLLLLGAPSPLLVLQLAAAVGEAVVEAAAAVEGFAEVEVH